MMGRDTEECPEPWVFLAQQIYLTSDYDITIVHKRNLNVDSDKIVSLCWKESLLFIKYFKQSRKWFRHFFKIATLMSDWKGDWVKSKQVYWGVRSVKCQLCHLICTLYTNDRIVHSAHLYYLICTLYTNDRIVHSVHLYYLICGLYTTGRIVHSVHLYYIICTLFTNDRIVQFFSPTLANKWR